MCHNDPLMNTKSILAEPVRYKTRNQDRVGVALENERMVICFNIKVTNSQYSEIDEYERRPHSTEENRR